MSADLTTSSAPIRTPLILDAQVHVYEHDHPGRPWIMSAMPGPSEVTGEDMIAAMDAVGVDGALVVSSFGAYGFDPSYALEAVTAHPNRLAVITQVDPRREDVGEVIEVWAATPGAVGLRLMTARVPGAMDVGEPDIEDRGIRQAMAAAARSGLPVSLTCHGRLSFAAQLAAANPDTQLILDHLGMAQPLEPPPPTEPFADLTDVLALASYPNVAVKVTGAPTLSHESFPFLDIRHPLGRVFEAFGFERCIWGSDWTRTTAIVDYHDSVAAFRDTGWLSDADRAALMGGSLERMFGWSPSQRSPESALDPDAMSVTDPGAR